MSSICEDEFLWDSFFGPTDSRANDYEIYHLRSFEWYSDGKQAQHLPIPTTAALLERDKDTTCSLRIITAPYLTAGRGVSKAFRSVCKHYAVPSAALSERTQGVTNSFGARSGADVETAWFSFLCKDVPPPPPDLNEVGNADLMRELGGSNKWWKSSYHLHVRKKTDATSQCVTLLCFGSPHPLLARFERLLDHSRWKDAVDEPFLLFAIVFDELYQLIDNIAWGVADLYRPMEFSVLERAKDSRASTRYQAVDFAMLHNTAKNSIYLNEAAEAALLTLGNMVSHLEYVHRQTTALGQPPTSSVAVQVLTYRKQTFQSTQLRLRSLSARMDNIISLSFNLVTQQDSRTMQNDSNAMKAIAVLTLIFLPVTGIGTIFSTPFFDVDFQSQDRMLQVAKSFWIFWVITIPSTFLMFGAWLVWYREAKLRKIGVMTGRLGPDKVAKATA